MVYYLRKHIDESGRHCEAGSVYLRPSPCFSEGSDHGDDTIIDCYIRDEWWRTTAIVECAAADDDVMVGAGGQEYEKVKERE